MATDGPTPPACDQEIFDEGEPIALLDGSSNAINRWVQAVAATANARLDWHYSGGIGQVLHLGDGDSRARTEAAIDALQDTLDGDILQRLTPGSPGRFRHGITEVPEGTIAVFSDGESRYEAFVIHNDPAGLA